MKVSESHAAHAVTLHRLVREHACPRGSDEQSQNNVPRKQLISLPSVALLSRSLLISRLVFNYGAMWRTWLMGPTLVTPGQKSRSRRSPRSPFLDSFRLALSVSHPWNRLVSGGAVAFFGFRAPNGGKECILAATVRRSLAPIRAGMNARSSGHFRITAYIVATYSRFG
jgi:hypothetical protein